MNERESGFTERIKQDGRQTLESGKRTAASHIQEIAYAIERARQELDQNDPTLAVYANRIADGVSRLATRLREDSIDDLVEQTRQLARRNPAAFLTGGIVLGIAVSRFLKASERSGMETPRV